MSKQRKISDPVVRAAADDIITNGGSTVITIITPEKSRRARAEALPLDLRLRYSQRRLSLEQAEAWAKLQEVFGGDRNAAAECVLTAMGAA